MRFVVLYPFAATPSSAGLSLEVIPLRDALVAGGHEVTIYCTGTRANYVDVSSPSDQNQLPALPSFLPEIHEGVAQLIDEVIGLIVPPIFRPYDLVMGLRPIREMRTAQCIIAFKPWFRTIIPALKYSRQTGAVPLLWLDDYDISPSSWILRKFPLVVVNSRELELIYHRAKPLLLPHNIETASYEGIGTALHSGEPFVVVVLLPSTGLPKLEVVKLLTAISEGTSNGAIGVLSAGSELRSAILTSRNMARIQFIPRVSRSEVLRFLAGAKLAVIPQPLTKYGRAKASGRLLESLALGVPSLVPSIGESARIISDSDAGIAYNPAHLQSLTSAVRYLLSDDTAWNRASKAAKNFTARRSSWISNAVRIAQEVERVWSGHSGQGDVHSGN